MTGKKQTNGVFLVIIAAMLWGTTGTSQALAPQGATPLAIGAVRLSLGGLALLIFSIIKGHFKGIVHWPILTTFLAAVSVALYQPFFFAGVLRTGVAIGTVVAIGSSPVFAGILGYFFRGEKPGTKWFIATGLAIVGNLLLILSENDLSVNFLGIIFALCAGLAYALYSLASKKLLDKYPSQLVVAIVFTLGSILLIPLLITSDLSWLKSVRGFAVATHLGFFTIALAYSLYARGLKKVTVADAVTLTLAEPITAAILGIFLLGEKINFFAGLGIAFLLIGIVVLSVNFNKKGTGVNGTG
jgi:DME family drug/metabolite transporter